MTNKIGGAGIGGPDNPLKGAVYTKHYLIKVGLHKIVEIWARNSQGEYVDFAGVHKDNFNDLENAIESAHKIVNLKNKEIPYRTPHRSFLVAGGLLIAANDSGDATMPLECLRIPQIKTIEHDKDDNVLVVGPDDYQAISFVKTAMDSLVEAVWGGK